MSLLASCYPFQATESTALPWISHWISGRLLECMTWTSELSRTWKMCVSNLLQGNCSYLHAAARAMLCSCSGLSMKQIIRSTVRITHDAWLCGIRLPRNWSSAADGVDTGQGAAVWHCSAQGTDENRSAQLSASTSSACEVMFVMSHLKKCIKSGFFWKRLYKSEHIIVALIGIGFTLWS